MCRRLARIGAVLFVLACAYYAVLRWPQWAFAYRYAEADLSIYSDEPFAESDARALLARVRQSLAMSPLLDTARHRRAFICNTRWRQRLFMAIAPQAGGIHYLGTPNAFFSGADLAANKLLKHGRPVNGILELDGFITHEFTHDLTAEALGWIRFQLLPDWKREGYADYVARGSVYAHTEARVAFLQETREMNWPARAPYLRFNLLVGYCLEGRGMTLAEFFATPLSRAALEAETRQMLARSP